MANLDPVKHLKTTDKVLAKIIASHKLGERKSHKRYFEALASAIIGQQISTKAAASIRKKFVELFDPKAKPKDRPERSRGANKFPKPEQILNTSDDALRSAGLSFQKISYIRSLSELVLGGEIKFSKFAKMTDGEIIEVLVKVKGIGQWTAEMFLMFCLGRPDVFSHGDLGLKNAIKKHYKINIIDHPKKYHKLVNSWSPYKTTAARYLWVSLG